MLVQGRVIASLFVMITSIWICEALSPKSGIFTYTSSGPPRPKPKYRRNTSHNSFVTASRYTINPDCLLMIPATPSFNPCNKPALCGRCKNCLSVWIDSCGKAEYLRVGLLLVLDLR